MGFFERANQRIEIETIGLALDNFADIGADGTTVAHGGWGSGTVKLAGDAACNNNTKTHTLVQTLTLGNGLVTTASLNTAYGEASTDDELTLKVSARLTGTPATSAQLDAEVRVSTGEGAAGSDLVTTAAQNLLTAGAGTWDEYAFTIDGTLAEGNELTVTLRAVLNDTGGSGGGTIEIGKVWVEVPMRG